MDTFFQDIRYGVKILVKNPGFTAVALIALALGIGANSAIFSVVNSVLLRPLPYSDSSRLVWLSDKQETELTPAAYQEFDSWRSGNQVFESIAGSFGNDNILTGIGEPETVRLLRVSASLFPMLGINAAAGRTFLPEEDRPGINVVLLSNGLWKRRFGSDPSIVGKNLTLGGKSYTVVGILQPDSGPVLGRSEVFRPLAIDPSTVSRGLHFMNVIAKMKPGITLAQAQGNLDSVAEGYRRENSTTHGVSMTPLQNYYVGDTRATIWILFGAVGFVLLIACANVANLLLARAAAREKEISLRVALGAGRQRIVRQLLTESILLAIAGGALGVMFAYWGVRLLISLGPESVPRLKEIGLDWKVVAFTVLLSIGSGIIFGLFPALRSSRPNLNDSLKGAGRSVAGGFGGFSVRSVLIVSQVALTLVLLIGAGLLIKSFIRVSYVNPGFNPDNVLTMNISLPLSRYGKDPQQSAFYQDLLTRVKGLPGVQHAGLINDLPLGGGGTNGDFEVEGHAPWPAGQEPIAEKYVTSPEYFQAMGISLLKGRFFTDNDAKGALPVVIINQSLAKQIWPNEDPSESAFASAGSTKTGRKLSVSSTTPNTSHWKLRTRWRPICLSRRHRFPGLLWLHELDRTQCR